MKNILLLSVLIVMLSCGTQKIVSFEYSVVTRGYKKSVFVTRNSTIISEKNSQQTSVTTTKTKSNYWKALQRGALDIELDKISTLESPTHKRDMDAAMFAKLIIKTKDSTYTSSSFDNGHPPEMLQTVVDSLANFGLEKKNEK